MQKQTQQSDDEGPTPVLDAAIELLAVYQMQFGVRSIALDRLPSGEIAVSLLSAGSGEARVPYGRIDRFTKRLVRD